MTPLTACGHPSQSFTKSWPSTTPELWTCPLPCLVQGGPWAGHPEVFSHLFGTTILSCLSLPGHLPEPCLTSASVSTSVKRGCVHPHAGAPTLREQGCHRGPCTPRIIRTAKRRCWGQAPWGECSVPLPPTWCGVGSGGPSTDARGGPGNPSCPTLWIRVTLPAGGLGKPCSHCYPGGGSPRFDLGPGELVSIWPNPAGCVLVGACFMVPSLPVGSPWKASPPHRGER